MFGSSETTFYVLAVYFGSVSIEKSEDTHDFNFEEWWVSWLFSWLFYSLGGLYCMS